jgi:hypothetical protein
MAFKRSGVRSPSAPPQLIPYGNAGIKYRLRFPVFCSASQIHSAVQKETSALRRILVLASVGMFLCVCAVATHAEGPRRPADVQIQSGHASVVIGIYGGCVSSLTVTLGTDTSHAEAARIFERIEQHTHWQFDTPIVRKDGYTSIQANALGRDVVELSGLEPVAPLIMSLPQQKRLVVVFIGVDRTRDGAGRFANDYVTAEWVQSGGVRSYQIAVSDRRVADIAQLVAPRRETETTGGRVDHITPLWLLLFLGSLATAALVYALSRYLVRRQATG